MCSYSTINGTYACQNPYILTTALRQQFGFGGFVTSDWGATHSTAASANAGMNMDMPGNDGYYGTNLTNAVNSGSVPKATLDALTSQVLTELFGFGLFDKPQTGSPGQSATSAAHVTTARQVSEEGTVLLKNSGSVLPFGSSVKSIAVIGADASTSPQTDGGGSAGVNSSGTVTPLQGITSRAGSGITVSYNNGSSSSSAASLAASSSVAVVFVSKFESEGSDLSNIDLASSDNSLISAVAAANPHTIVVLNSGSAVTMPWLSSVAGVFEAWYPGQEDGNAIARAAVRRRQPLRQPAGDVPDLAVAGPREHRRAVAGHQRPGAVLGGRRRRLPLVRRQGPDAALPVRLRPVLHQLLLQQPVHQPAGQGRRRDGHRHGDQHRYPRGRRRGAAVRDRPGRVG